jgi:TRAP-type C4-dicarboxylate transport system permease small subunit
MVIGPGNLPGAAAPGVMSQVTGYRDLGGTMVSYDYSFERDDDIGVSAMSTIGSWKRKGLTILLSAILLLFAIFVIIVLFNEYSESWNESETEEDIQEQVDKVKLIHMIILMYLVICILMY